MTSIPAIKLRSAEFKAKFPDTFPNAFLVPDPGQKMGIAANRVSLFRYRVPIS